MRVQDIMNRSVETVSPRDTVVFANEVMWRKRIHHLVVMDHDEVVGVLSDTDLGGSQARDLPDGQRVAKAMSPAPVTATPETTVDRVANIFRERHISCLPVLDHGKLVGIVTTTDLENLTKRGLSNQPYQGVDAGPYPPLHSGQGKPANRAGHD